MDPPQEPHAASPLTSPEILSPGGKSRYGRTRRPKITRDFYNIDDVVIEENPPIKSPKLKPPPKSPTIRREVVFEIKDEFTKLDDLGMKVANNFKANLQRGLDDRIKERKFFKSMPENKPDVPNVVDVTKVFKLISTKPVLEVSEGRSPPKSALKTYSNKRKHLHDSDSFIVESFGLPDEPIIPVASPPAIERNMKIDVDANCEVDVNLANPWSFEEYDPVPLYASEPTSIEEMNFRGGMLDMCSCDSLSEKAEIDRVFDITSNCQKIFEKSRIPVPLLPVKGASGDSWSGDYVKKRKKVLKNALEFSKNERAQRETKNKINKDKKEVGANVTKVLNKNSSPLKKKRKFEHFPHRILRSSIDNNNEIKKDNSKDSQATDIFTAINISKTEGQVINPVNISKVICNSQVRVILNPLACINKVPQRKELVLNPFRSESRLKNKIKKTESLKSPQKKGNGVTEALIGFNRNVLKKIDPKKNVRDLTENDPEVKTEEIDLKNIKTEPIEFEVGDLAWAKIGTHPYWPCMITQEPKSGDHKRTIVNRTQPQYHVRFFGDKGRRSWVSAQYVMSYYGRDDLENIAKVLKAENKVRAFFIKEAYVVKPKKLAKWQEGVDEAEKLKGKPLDERLNYFSEVFARERERKERWKELAKSEGSLKGETEGSLKSKKRARRSQDDRIAKKKKIEEINSESLVKELPEVKEDDIGEEQKEVKKKPKEIAAEDAKESPEERKKLKEDVIKILDTTEEEIQTVENKVKKTAFRRNPRNTSMGNLSRTRKSKNVEKKSISIEENETSKKDENRKNEDSSEKRAKMKKKSMVDEEEFALSARKSKNVEKKSISSTETEKNEAEKETSIATLKKDENLKNEDSPKKSTKMKKKCLVNEETKEELALSTRLGAKKKSPTCEKLSDEDLPLSTRLDAKMKKSSVKETCEEDISLPLQPEAKVKKKSSAKETSEEDISLPLQPEAKAKKKSSAKETSEEDISLPLQPEAKAKKKSSAKETGEEDISLPLQPEAKAKKKSSAKETREEDISSPLQTEAKAKKKSSAKETREEDISLPLQPEAKAKKKSSAKETREEDISSPLQTEAKAKKKSSAKEASEEDISLPLQPEAKAKKKSSAKETREEDISSPLQTEAKAKKKSSAKETSEEDISLPLQTEAKAKKKTSAKETSEGDISSPLQPEAKAKNKSSVKETSEEGISLSLRLEAKAKMKSSASEETTEADFPLPLQMEPPKRQSLKENNRKSIPKRPSETRKKFQKKEEFSKESLEARKKLRNFQNKNESVESIQEVPKIPKRNSVEEKEETGEKEPKLRNKRHQIPGEYSNSDTDSKFSDNSSVPTSLESQAALYRRNNIFRGIPKEKVCQICEEVGEVFKCKGPCNGVYHYKCATNVINADDEKKKEEDEGRVEGKVNQKEKETANVEIVEVDSKKPLPNLSDSPNFKGMTLAEKIDFRMKEIMKKFDYQSVYAESTDSSSEELLLDESLEKLKNQSKLSLTVTQKPTKKEVPIIKHVTADNISYICVTDEKPKEKVVADVIRDNQQIFKCFWCVTEETPLCLICNKEESKTGSKFRQKCSLHQCGKYYHPECLKVWPQTQWSLLQSTKDAKYDTFVCPRHVCHTCISDDPRASNSRCPSDKVVKCLRCPATYHTSNYCVPAGTHILSTSQVICPRHFTTNQKLLRRGMQQTINTNWCFICSKGGNLICCETCPTSVHVECLPGDLNEDDTFFCEDCQSGRLPLYDEIVWVKLGTFRWWPALILFPNEVPDNVRNIPHNKGQFVVKFFGTYDHYWVGRGRTFLFQEGDKGHSNSVKKRVDNAFAKAIEEAAAAHQMKKQFKLNKVAEKNTGLKPPPYIRIKVNKPVGNVRLFDGNTSNTTSCDCDPNEAHPCGPDSDCLNRLLLTECNPQVCPAGERCKNQCFEKREYPPLVPHRTQVRGWGLKTLAPVRKGQFVIEYVGEIIDEQEYQRRIQKMHEQKEENYYFLTIDKDRTLDAGPKGNVARFMNHSCQPNCETQKWTVNGDTRVGLFAKWDIPADTELTFNYNLECIGKEKKICKCGAPNCTGFIGVKTREGSRKSSSKAKKKKIPAPEVVDNENPCFICGKVGDAGACNNKVCTKYYHLSCVGLTSWPEGGKWVCQWHNCNICSKRTIRCCVKCVNSYCPSHSGGNVRYDKVLGFICFVHDPSQTHASVEKATSPEQEPKSLDDSEIRLSGCATSTPVKKSNPKSSKKKKRGKKVTKVENKKVKNTASLFNTAEHEVKLTKFTPVKYLRTCRSQTSLNRTDPDKDLPIRKRNRLRCGNTL